VLRGGDGRDWRIWLRGVGVDVDVVVNFDGDGDVDGDVTL
jgi:hypothetical protein